MTEIKVLKISDCSLELKREIITNEANINKFIDRIKALKTRVFDFSTKEGIKEAKELKTEANKFVKELKEFCDPLEADGKKVAEARSKITTTLATGKEAVIDQILAPVIEREEKIKVIKGKLFVPSLDSSSNVAKLAEIESLKDYKWLAYEEEATQLLEQHKQFLLNEKIKFDKQERLAKEEAEKARLAREEAIRIEAETKAKLAAQKEIDEANARAEKARLAREDAIRVEAEAKAKLAAQKEIDEANARAEKARLDAEAKIEEVKNSITSDIAKIQESKPEVKITIPTSSVDQNRKRQIYNEMIEDLAEVLTGDIQEAKNLIKAIAEKKIRHLLIINY